MTNKEKEISLFGNALTVAGQVFYVTSCFFQCYLTDVIYNDEEILIVDLWYCAKFNCPANSVSTSGPPDPWNLVFLRPFHTTRVEDLENTVVRLF